MAHHYSETEQRIDTWVDGKPLYEITKNITPSAVGQLLFDITDLHIDKLISVDGTFTRVVNGNVQSYAHGVYENSSLYEYVRTQIRDGVANGNLLCNLNYEASTSIIIILQYTKTTD